MKHAFENVPLGLNPIQHTAAWALYVNQMKKLGYRIEFGKLTQIDPEHFKKVFGGKTKIDGRRQWK